MKSVSTICFTMKALTSLVPLLEQRVFGLFTSIPVGQEVSLCKELNFRFAAVVVFLICFLPLSGLAKFIRAVKSCYDTIRNFTHHWSLSYVARRIPRKRRVAFFHQKRTVYLLFIMSESSSKLQYLRYIFPSHIQRLIFSEMDTPH